MGSVVCWTMTRTTRLLLLLSVCTMAMVGAAGTRTKEVVVVDCPFGQIQGVRKTDQATGLASVSFKGIPYAKPPVGQLRFAKPQPHPKIEGVFDATKDAEIICLHPDLIGANETEGFSEDCLILNVYAKDIPPPPTPQEGGSGGSGRGGSLRKVVVFIHGGGFILGSSSFYDPSSFVIGQDVLVVTVNYRLGVLGFLSTDNEASPGNYGLWDQTLALTWVKDNIRAFGGDPDDVTLAGESAGGSSVGFQMITPHAKGLFAKAYPQSGTAAAPFALTKDSQKHTLEIAQKAGCWDKEMDYKMSVEESRQVVACLRACPVSNFTAFNEVTLTKTMFVPVVDGDFITDTPANLLRDEAYLESVGFFDRPYLIAINNFEAGVLITLPGVSEHAVYSYDNATKEEKDRVWGQMNAPSSNRLNLKTGLGEDEDGKVSGAIQEFYARRFSDSRKALVELVIDVNFVIPALDLARVASRHANSEVYFLHFDHFPTFMTSGLYRGMSHGLDLLYWFDGTLEDLDKMLWLGIGGEIPEEDLKLKGMFSSLFGEFVRSGKPGKALEAMTGSGWPKYDVTNGYYLNFNLNPWVSNFLAKDKQDFWFETVPRLMAETGGETSDCKSHTEL